MSLPTFDPGQWSGCHLVPKVSEGVVDVNVKVETFLFSHVAFEAWHVPKAVEYYLQTKYFFYLDQLLSFSIQNLNTNELDFIGRLSALKFSQLTITSEKIKVDQQQ